MAYPDPLNMAFKTHAVYLSQCPLLSLERVQSYFARFGLSVSETTGVLYLWG
ncbi:hypothetical protein MNB_SUP05-SYMBIONT-5-1274 [hydrothermal vent metagenome]|uniref:Uncharacterized protein n=1 Tax=hydrothermal vent metagenome TaxID=652676 RepID=A0A1W1E320_9ZZZZ